jgi:hypothetical protein
LRTQARQELLPEEGAQAGGLFAPGLGALSARSGEAWVSPAADAYRRPESGEFGPVASEAAAAGQTWPGGVALLTMDVVGQSLILSDGGLIASAASRAALAAQAEVRPAAAPGAVARLRGEPDGQARPATRPLTGGLLRPAGKSKPEPVWRGLGSTRRARAAAFQLEAPVLALRAGILGAGALSAGTAPAAALAFLPFLLLALALPAERR